MSILGKRIACLMLSVAVAGCGSETSTSETSNKRFGREQFDVGDCNQHPLTGTDFKQQTYSTQVQNSEYFAKEFLPGQWRAAFSSSSYSVARQLFDEGVQIYQVPSGAAPECRYFDFLNLPTAEAQKNWNAAKGGGAINSQLLGLFTTIYSRNSSNLQSHLTSPTILLLDSTKKWTLLHEMSHYLFAKSRARQFNLQFNSEIQQQIVNLGNSIRTRMGMYEEAPSEAIGLEVVKLFHQHFDLHFELDKRTALEEFTIESMLLEQAKASQILGISGSQDQKNALSYMRSNSRTVVNSYLKKIAELDDLDERFFKNQWPAVSNEIVILTYKIERQIEFIRKKIANAETASETKKGRRHREALGKATPPEHSHYDLHSFEQRHQDLMPITR